MNLTNILIRFSSNRKYTETEIMFLRIHVFWDQLCQAERDLREIHWGLSNQWLTSPHGVACSYTVTLTTTEYRVTEWSSGDKSQLNNATTVSFIIEPLLFISLELIFGVIGKVKAKSRQLYFAFIALVFFDLSGLFLAWIQAHSSSPSSSSSLDI